MLNNILLRFPIVNGCKKHFNDMNDVTVLSLNIGRLRYHEEYDLVKEIFL